MKTYSQSYYKRHDAITFLLFIAMMCAIIITAITHTSCATQHSNASYDMSCMQDTAKWNAFYKCSADEGDYGCDSCFYKIFGYHAEDAGYLNYKKEE
jgi:hypothetical protein